jgi:hypothetical protein
MANRKMNPLSLSYSRYKFDTQSLLTIFHQQYNSAESSYILYSLTMHEKFTSSTYICLCFIAGTYVFAGNVAAANRRVSASAIASVLLKGNC